ncbi:hypothetical protein PHAVU_006G033200 [Phaseolus vulgaris]|uniref:Thaumatin-like protein n=1 Tax=Phaseolus vulgaris TaxID=3885 RepID=V7BK28_PHAVU|nr:hypothetical protein PHAVU_006G033200g [Phaseolus vulgaris]ESW18344.1 hypothetical protein PHAVU_006G033200g [Phaseolus vulgaris]
MLHSTCFFSLFLSLTLHLSGTDSANITLINQCNYTVWPAFSSYNHVNLSTTGFVLPSGKNASVNVPVNWNGRIWGRTLCTTDTVTGNFSCVTGDCNSGKIACDSGGSERRSIVALETVPRANQLRSPNFSRRNVPKPTATGKTTQRAPSPVPLLQTTTLSSALNLPMTG